MSKKISERNKSALSAEDLWGHLTYDSATGIFVWKPRRWRSAKGEAGSMHPHGYRVITINDIQYPAHRLAWLYHYGSWPKLELDHKDGDRSNNRIDSLREATQSQNNGNMRVSPRNPTGFKGVRKKGKKWEAFLYSNRRGFYLGTFNSPKEASEAYLAKAREIYGEFARAA